MSYIGSKPANKPVVASDLDPTVITGQTALATSPADTDEFLISDAGVLKRLDASLIGGGGKILQVVTATDGTSRGSTSSSFVTASNTLSVSITPSSASSKIFILYTGAVQNAGATNATSWFTIYRGGTNIGGGSNSALGSAYINANNMVSNMSIGYLDSPSTTSATTYQVYFKNDNSTTVYLNAQGTLSSITAFEVGA